MAIPMRLPVAEGLLVTPILLGFVYLILLVTLRYVLRVRGVVPVVFIAIVPFLALGDRSFDTLPWSLAAGLAWGGLILVLLRRFGVLALIVCVFCDEVLWRAPLTPDLSAWYAHATIVPVGVVAALAVFGVYAATYGRPILRAERAG